MRIDKEKFTPEFTPPPPRYIITLNMNEEEYQRLRYLMGSTHTVPKSLFGPDNDNQRNLKDFMAQIYSALVDLDK